MKLSKIYVDKVARSGFPIVTAYLYGSFAKGQPRADSDIDVAIVTSGKARDEWSDHIALQRIAWDVDSRFEVKVFSPDRFEDWHPLVHEIMTTGISLLAPTK